MKKAMFEKIWKIMYNRLDFAADDVESINGWQMYSVCFREVLFCLVASHKHVMCQ